MHVDGPFQRVALRRPVERIEQGLAREDAAARLHERDQKAELGGRQRHGLAFATHLDAVEIDHQVTVLEHPVSLPRSIEVLASPQDRFDANHQLRRRKWLGEIVVGALVDAVDAVRDLSARGEHHDGHGGALTQDSHQGKPVQLGISKG